MLLVFQATSDALYSFVGLVVTIKGPSQNSLRMFCLFLNLHSFLMAYHVLGCMHSMPLLFLLICRKNLSSGHGTC